MRKTIELLLFLYSVTTFLWNLSNPNIVHATSKCDSTFVNNSTPSSVTHLDTINVNFTVRFKDGSIVNGTTYDIKVEVRGGYFVPLGTAVAQNGQISFSGTHTFADADRIQYLVITGPSNIPNCSILNFSVQGAKIGYSNIYLSQSRNGQTCYGGYGVTDGCIEKGLPTTINILGLKRGNVPYSGTISVEVTAGSSIFADPVVAANNGNITKNLLFNPANARSHTLHVWDSNTSADFYKKAFFVQESCAGTCQTETPSVAGQTGSQASEYKICDQIPESLSDQRLSCLDCVGDEDGYGGIWTAIGCIPNDPETIVKVFLRFGLGMGGGVALLMILGAGFMLTVSQGDPKQTDTAKQWLSSAIAGLLFIIFSVTILQFIGYNVFQIPGFGG